MQKVRHNPLNLIAAHTALIVYTLIALFPVVVILINSVKTEFQCIAIGFDQLLFTGKLFGNQLLQHVHVYIEQRCKSTHINYVFK